MGKNIEDNLIPLRDVIGAIQEELIASQKKRERSGRPRLFQTDHLTLEVNCVITKEHSAKGGLGIRILAGGIELNSGTERIYEESVTQKITIEFKVNEQGEMAFKGPEIPVDEDTGKYPHSEMPEEYLAPAAPERFGL